MHTENRKRRFAVDMGEIKTNRYDNLTETQISSQEIFKGVVCHLFKDRVRLCNGDESVREVLRGCRAVCVIPLDSEGNVTMVSQYRYAHSKVLLEIPAGKCDEGEDFLCAAERELMEETGLRAGKYTFLGEIYTTPAFVDEVIYMYLATELDESGVQKLDRDEFLNVDKIPLDTLFEMVLDGRIKDAKTQVAVLKVHAMREKGSV